MSKTYSCAYFILLFVIYSVFNYEWKKMSILEKDNDMTCQYQCQCLSIFKLSKILTVGEKKIIVNVYFWHFFGIFFWENKLIRENLIRTPRYKNSWFFSRRELLSRFEIITVNLHAQRQGKKMKNMRGVSDCVS